MATGIKKLKKTTYFISNQSIFSNMEDLLTSTIEKRDTFLEKNIKNIAKVDSEDIITPTNNGYVRVIIKLSYYEL